MCVCVCVCGGQESGEAPTSRDIAHQRQGAEFIYQGSVSLLNICSTYFSHSCGRGIYIPGEGAKAATVGRARGDDGAGVGHGWRGGSCVVPSRCTSCLAAPEISEAAAKNAGSFAVSVASVMTAESLGEEPAKRQAMRQAHSLCARMSAAISKTGSASPAAARASARARALRRAAPPHDDAILASMRDVGSVASSIHSSSRLRH